CVCVCVCGFCGVCVWGGGGVRVYVCMCMCVLISHNYYCFHIKLYSNDNNIQILPIHVLPVVRKEKFPIVACCQKSCMIYTRNILKIMLPNDHITMGDHLSGIRDYVHLTCVIYTQHTQSFLHQILFKG
ncbi:unnamed protein product, partial [Meganyctiphanes norvegica]